MELNEAFEIICALFQRYGFMLNYEANYDEEGGYWSILAAPITDKSIILFAELMKKDIPAELLESYTVPPFLANDPQEKPNGSSD